MREKFTKKQSELIASENKASKVKFLQNRAVCPLINPEAETIINSSDIIIYGPGESGHYLASQLNKSVQYKTVAFVDDNEKLHKSNLRGIKVYSPNDLPNLIKKYKVAGTMKYCIVKVKLLATSF